MWLICMALTLLLIKLFNKLSTGKCYSDCVMSGKVVIVTGANSGVGYETAKDMARRGAKVILACRDDKKGSDAAEAIRKATKNHNVKYQHLDLSSFNAIRQFVEHFKKSEAKLEVLINNARASGVNQKTTTDGLARDMQVNHFGPFLLTLLLVPMLRKSAPSRVIVISSSLHKFGTIENLNEHCSYFQLYANSTLCSILFSNELARRLEGTGVVVNSVNPGNVNTSLYRSTLTEKLRSLILYTFFKSPAEGAQTAIHLAVSDDCDQVTGRYFADCVEAKMSWKAEDRVLAANLWSVSEECVKLKPGEMV